MKREDLEKLGLTAEAIEKAGLSADVVDKIMSLHGKDIESHKSKLTEANSTADNLKQQLEEATKQIEGFKGMKSPEEVDAAINEWKTKADQATKDAADMVAKLKFDHALQGELGKAKVKNAKAITPLLDMEALQKGYNDKDDSFLGLDKQIEALKESDAYLFADSDETPRIVTGGNNQTVITDPVVVAARKAAGLEDGKK